MEEKIFGEVFDIKDGKIFVKIKLLSACSSCSHSQECAIFSKDQNKIVESDNISGEKVEKGDIVELMIERKKILLLSFVFYIVPTILIFIFSLVGYSLKKGEGMVAIFAFIGFLISILTIFIFNKNKKEEFNHKIVRVLK